MREQQEPERSTIGIDFEEEAKAILKSELKRRRLTYSDLAERFTRFGLPMTEPTLRNKISRGSFNAAFFLNCLALIGAETIHITQYVTLRSDQPKPVQEP